MSQLAETVRKSGGWGFFLLCQYIYFLIKLDPILYPILCYFTLWAFLWWTILDTEKEPHFFLLLQSVHLSTFRKGAADSSAATAALPAVLSPPAGHVNLCRQGFNFYLCVLWLSRLAFTLKIVFKLMFFCS